jgi:hypothetical protein
MDSINHAPKQLKLEQSEEMYNLREKHYEKLNLKKEILGLLKIAIIVLVISVLICFVLLFTEK